MQIYLTNYRSTKKKKINFHSMEIYGSLNKKKTCLFSRTVRVTKCLRKSDSTPLQMVEVRDNTIHEMFDSRDRTPSLRFRRRSRSVARP